MKLSTQTPIALVGYGAMGKELERLSAQCGCVVTEIFDIKRPLTIDGAVSTNFDVAIDFSVPAAVLENTHVLAQAGKHVIIGTTGWSAQSNAIRAIVEQHNIGAVYSANFSVGVQMFFQIIRLAAELVNRYDEYDVALHELHHRRKLDAPSGTALSLAHILETEIERKSSFLVDASHGQIAPDALHLSSTRVGDVPGTHTVYLDSAADTLELTHRARNRSGFAIGALRAARWIASRKGFYEFSEIFSTLHEIPNA